MSLFKNLRAWLGMTVLAGSLLVPNEGKAIGTMQLWNESPNPGPIYDNKVVFIENGSDGSYLATFQPAMEIFYEDSNSNQCSTAGVDLSTNKTYNCPLVYSGTIPNGATNRVAFKLVNDFPSNTHCSADIVVDGKYTNSIDDVIAYTKANSNAQGYAFVNLPNVTNAVDGARYGHVTMHFAPIFDVVSSNGANGTISPAGTNKVVWGEGTNFNINANPNYHISTIVTNGASAFTNTANNVASTNFIWNNITQNGTINANFDINKFNLQVQSAYGSPTGAGTYNYGTSATSTVEKAVDTAPGARKRVTGFTLENL